MQLDLWNPKFLFWNDIETTGLNPRSDHLLEVSYIITEFNYPYNTIHEDTHLILGNGRESIFNAVDGFPSYIDSNVVEMHHKSGLVEDLKDISKCITVLEVERNLLNLSFNWPLPDKTASAEEKSQKVCIAGNSCHFDLGFIRQYMPAFAKRLSYRTFDVRAISMFCASLGMPKKTEKEPTHRAKDDIQYSINHARECYEWLNEHFTTKYRDESTKTVL